MTVPINVDYRDGRFTMRRVDTERYKDWPIHFHIPIDTWCRYELHLQADFTWQEIIADYERKRYNQNE